MRHVMVRVLAAGLLVLFGPVAPAGAQTVAQGKAPARTDTGEALDPMEQLVSVRLIEVPLSQALEVIAQRGGVKLARSSSLMPADQKVTVNVRRGPLRQALEQALVGTGLEVVVVSGDVLALVRAKSRSTAPAGQGGSVVGLITDAKTGQPLGAVEVTLDNRQWRTTTDADGRYRLANVAPGSYTVVARRIGYAPERRPVTVNAGREAPVDVALQAAATRLGDVVVTAQKREERAFDVPISIVAMSAEELEQRKVTNLDDLALAVPGLAVQSSGSAQRRIFLRGIGNTFGNASLIGVYLDEASVTAGGGIAGPDRQFDLRTYDLERVEVLRGPQGTLYGEGAVGGTIRFITKDPLLDQFAMKADVTALFTQDGAPSQRVQGVLNVPLLEDELGLRITGTFDHEGGWMDQPAADRKNFNDQDLVNVRVKGLWQPAPQFRVNAMAVIHRNDAPPSSGEDANGNYTQVINPTATPSVTDDYDVYNLTLTYDFAAVRILSTTSYSTQEKESRDRGFRLPLLGPPGTPILEVLHAPWARDAKVLTDELRLTSTGSGPWQWTVGGFYRHDRTNAFGDFLLGIGTFTFPATIGPSSDLSESWAGFGDLSYQLRDRLTLGTGLRYFGDAREVTDPLGGIQTGKFDALNPRAYARYQLTGNINTYASAAKGFRSGGLNGEFLPPYDPEHVWTYELGTKMSLLEGRLSADAAVFYSDYTNFQILGLEVRELNPGELPRYFMQNAGDARVKGIEWALTWRPADPWSLSFNGSYMDTRLHEVRVVPASASYAVGDPLPLVPKYGYTVSAQRDFQWKGQSGFARLDYNHLGRSTYRNRSVGPWYYSESDLINMLNFTMSLPWSEHLALSLFAQNLLNDRGFTDAMGIEELAGRARPRTFGLGAGLTF